MFHTYFGDDNKDDKKDSSALDDFSEAFKRGREDAKKDKD